MEMNSALTELQSQMLMEHAFESVGMKVVHKPSIYKKRQELYEMLFQGRYTDLIPIQQGGDARNVERNGEVQTALTGPINETDETKKAEGDADSPPKTSSPEEQRVMALRAQIEALNSQFKKFELQYNALIRKIGNEDKSPKQFSSALPLGSLMGLQRGTLKDQNKNDIDGLQNKMAGILSQISQLQSMIATTMSAGLPSTPSFAGLQALG